MNAEVLPDPEQVARRAAAVIADEARRAAAARGRFLLATSGGTTPWRMLELLVDEDVPWPVTHLFQVDERVAGPADPGRNLARLRASLVDRVPLVPDHVHAMPVEDADLAAAAAAYAATLSRIGGTPPVLDLVHLGLGEDGHTASLVPGDRALEASQAEVAVTGPFHGFRRMTLTYPVLARARCILWVVTGAEKAGALQRLRARDPSLAATRVPDPHARVLADRAAIR